MATRPARYPLEGGGARTWRSVELVYIRSGQPRAYADTVDEFDAVFTGGTNSSREGQELAFASMRPLPEEDHPSVVFTTKPAAERAAEHRERVKAIVRLLAPHAWQYDRTAGETGLMGQTWLDGFECVAQDEFSSTYRFRVVTPFMD